MLDSLAAAASLLPLLFQPATLLRACLLTASAVGELLLVQAVVGAFVAAMVRRGGYERTARPPTRGRAAMLAASAAGWASYVAPACWLQAAWPLSWSFAPPSSVPQLLYTYLAFLLATDASYFAVHKWFHSSPRAFQTFHAKHHSPAGNLDVSSSAYLDVWGGVIEGGLMTAALYYFVHAATGNFWVFLMCLHGTWGINMVGHAGANVLCDHPAEVFWLALVPHIIMQWTLPTRTNAQDHEGHHKDPRSNLAPYFTHWDDINGSAGSPRHACSPLFFGVHLAYQAALVAALTCFAATPGWCVAAYCLAYLLVPPQAACRAVQALGVPEAARRACGWLADAYRRDALVSYEPAGQPGSFAGGPDSAVLTEQQQQQQPTFLFACHPTGLLSRGALLTFAARGWGSPVAGLPRVRLAVGRPAFSLPLPLSRELLLALGCVPADRSLLQRLLEDGTSVAVCPGGWSEPTHTAAYRLLLKQRLGFVSLAAETGAHLVPVLCLGEQVLAADLDKNPKPRPYPTFTAWTRRLLFSARPQPVRAVFGRPLAPQAGEGVGQLHGRYVAALHTLAAEQGACLELL